jgi:hypothetical protein
MGDAVLVSQPTLILPSTLGTLVHLRSVPDLPLLCDMEPTEACHCGSSTSAPCKYS